MDLNTLVKQNSSNYYKMLVIVDNSNQHDIIIKALSDKGWQAVDVTEASLHILERIPENQRIFEFGDALKKWFRELPDRVIFYNTSILYSPELGQLNPVGAFKYKSREKEIIVIMNGQLYGERIQYSELGRDDYCEIDISELIHTKIEDIEL